MRIQGRHGDSITQRQRRSDQTHATEGVRCGMDRHRCDDECVRELQWDASERVHAVGQHVCRLKRRCQASSSAQLLACWDPPEQCSSAQASRTRTCVSPVAADHWCVVVLCVCAVSRSAWISPARAAAGCRFGSALPALCQSHLVLLEVVYGPRLVLDHLEVLQAYRPALVVVVDSMLPVADGERLTHDLQLLDANRLIANRLLASKQAVHEQGCARVRGRSRLLPCVRSYRRRPPLTRVPPVGAPRLTLGGDPMGR